MFEFLFKYSPVVFAKGSIYFNYLPSLFVLLIIAAVLTVVLLVSYRKTTLAINRALKTTLVTLKFLALLLLFLALLQPVLSVSTITPRKSSLLILADDSRSMSIKDAAGGVARKKFVQNLLGTPEAGGLMADLRKNFKLQLYEFSSGVSHLETAAELDAGGDVTDLAGGLAFAADNSRQSAVSGVVILTDGLNNSERDPLEAAAILKSKNLPVFVVGVGSESTRDVELSKVVANHSVIENSVVEVSALIKNRNYDGEQVDIELLEEGRLVKSQTVSLKGAATRTSLTFSPQQRGFARYAVRVKTSKPEAITQNNSQNFIVDNRSRQARILFIDGYPRAEFKFLRRAVDADPSIDLVSLLRTGTDKFYRQGVENSDELKDGYPKNKEALFKYDAIIFGSIERSFFTESQLQNTVDFVSQRGGGFLMLGGSNSFAQGGYAKSSLAKVLPVELPRLAAGSLMQASTFRDMYQLLLTPEGYRNPMLQLSADESENRSKWESLPKLEGYNRVGRAKPGATILAVHPLSEQEDPKIIMAQQRFGRGRAMIFASSSSWHWQMGMPHADKSHERFWRQVLRWLALAAPDAIAAQTDKETYAPNQQVTLEVDVRNSTFETINDAKIKARITKPSGEIVEVPFKWSSNGKVEYLGAYHPDEQGMYLVAIDVYSASGEFLGKSESAFFVEESKAEFSNAHLHSAFLKRIAEVSGGKYYYQDAATALPDEISVRQSSYSKLVEHDLWDMPLLFLLVIFVVSAEWFLRRNKGLS